VSSYIRTYLVAISENTNSDILRIHQHHNHDERTIGMQQDRQQRQNQEHPLKQQKKAMPQKNPDELLKRANSTLDVISKRIWLDNWPTNVETLLKSSGPWHLRPYFYHNRTFWPWITGIEYLLEVDLKDLMNVIPFFPS
jgi:hypothetical protein